MIGDDRMEILSSQHDEAVKLPEELHVCTQVTNLTVQVAIKAEKEEEAPPAEEEEPEEQEPEVDEAAMAEMINMIEVDSNTAKKDEYGGFAV